MATASSNPVPQPSHSPRSAVDATAAINSPRSRRGPAPRGVSSPWTHIVRGGDFDLVASSSSGSSAPPFPIPARSPPSPSSDSQEPTSNLSDRPPSKAGSSASASASSSAPATSLPEDSTGEAQAQGSENENSGGSGNAAEKSPWSKPSNTATESGSVMGAAWPALSESTKASSKSSSTDLLKAASESFEPLSQGAGITSSSSHKQVTSNNANSNSSPSHVGPTRQKSFKRGGGISNHNALANGDFHQPPYASPQGAVVEMGTGKSGKVSEEPSFRDHAHKEGGQRGNLGGQLHGGNDHQQHRSTYRRGNGGPHPRGDGSYHHSYGGRRDHDRGNQDWNQHRSFGNRDPHIQQQRVAPRSFIRPPPHSSAPFIPPPVPLRPFGNAMLYPEMASPVIFVPGPPVDSLRGVPMVAPIPPPHAMFFPVPDPQLHAKIDPQLQARIVNQIDYYFSNENLIKDTFLRQNMDDQGWVPIELVAGFKKVKLLTDDIQLITDALRTSTVVEVQGDKVRKQNDWMKWIMPSYVQFSSVSSPQSFLRSTQDILANNFMNFNLDENIKRGNPDAYLSRTSSGESSNLSQQSSGNVAVQVNTQTGDEHAGPSRSSSR